MALIVKLNAIHIVTFLSQYNFCNYRHYKNNRQVLVTLCMYFVWHNLDTLLSKICVLVQTSKGKRLPLPQKNPV